MDLGSLPKLAGLLMLALSVVTLVRFSACNQGGDGDASDHGTRVDAPR